MSRKARQPIPRLDPTRASMPPLAAEAARSPSAVYHLSILPNGLRVATAEMPHMASVCVGLWAAVGSRHESARLNGAAHFLEHLLFKGTKRRSARRISGEVEGLGGYLEAFTAEDHTCYYAKAEAGRLRQLGDVLADIYAHSRLPAAEVERERGVIREEILMYQDQPAQVAEDLLAATMWAGHPLGRPLAGTLKSLGALRRDDLLTFWRNGYHAGATVLAVAGKVTHARVLEQLGPFLTELPPGRAPRCRAWRQTAPAARQRPQAVVQRQENEQVQVVLGFIAVGRHDPRRFALRVLNALLGEKMDSRLFQSLRERRGLCYSVQSELTTYAETGLLSISVGLDARQLRPALGLIRREIERLCAQPPGAREMREARDYLIGQHRLGLESTTSQMMWLAESILGHGRVARPEEAEEALAAVTAADVQAAACDALRDGFRALVAVGPVTAAPAEVLGWFGSV